MQFETIVLGLKEKNINFDILDTNKLNYPSRKNAFIAILGAYFKKVKKNDQVVYFSSTNYKYFLPFFLLKKLWSPHYLLLRKIGGDLEADYNASIWQRFYIHALYKQVQLILTEAKGLSNFLRSKGLNAKQLLNARKEPQAIRVLEPTSTLKIAYIGRLAQAKRVHHLVELDQQLINTNIDVYGPVESVSPELFEKTQNIRYCGSFNNEKIYTILENYHAVLLPTEFRGEGHPGILVEALMAGKPVITTDINYISEVVQDGYNGILIKDGSVSEIAKGIDRLKKADYVKLAENAKHSAKPYEVSINIEILLKEINYEN